MISKLSQTFFVGASRNYRKAIGQALILSLLLSICAPIALAQAPSTCTVSGTLYNPDATAAVGAQVRVSSVSKNGVLIAPGPFTYTANASGVVSFNIIRGTTAKLYSTVAPFNVVGGVTVSIPNAASADLSTLATVASVPTAGINVTTLASKEGTLTFNASHFTVTEPTPGEANIDVSFTPFVDPLTTRGDILFRNSSNATARLAVGGASTVLTSNGTDPSYGQVTNAMIAAAAGIPYSKLTLTGAILNADLAGSIADTKLSTIATAGKVSDSALSANIPLLNGANIFTPTVRSSGSASYFTINTPADTGMTASTESIGFKTVTGSRQWATGALTTQREFLFAAPTYRFVGASTLTNAATVAISGAPIGGTNATITNPFSLWVQGGNARFDGIITQSVGGADPLTATDQATPIVTTMGSASGDYADSASANIFQIMGFARNSGSAPVVALFGEAYAEGATSHAFGLNSTARAKANGAIANAAELDYGITVAGGHATGLLLVSANTQAADQSIGIQSATSAGSPNYGIVFAKNGSIHPTQTTGTLMYVSGAVSAANGIDLSNATFSGFAYKSTGFSVDGVGGLTTTTMITPLIAGGSAAGQFLLLRSTTGTGSGDTIRFQTGTNGGTEGGRFITNGSLGLGITAPLHQLHVAKSSSTAVEPFAIENPSTAATTTKSVAMIFRGEDTIATLKQVGAIRAVPTDSNWVGSNLTFETVDTSTFALTERVRITGTGDLTVNGLTNGQALNFQTKTELTTIAAAATTDTAITIPANAVVYGVTVRVTVVIPTAATFTVTGTTSGTAFNTAAVSTAATTTDVGTANCPYKNGAAQTIRITPNLTPASNSGRVRVTIHYYIPTAPAS